MPYDSAPLHASEAATRSRRQWSLERPSRLAALILLFIWVGPVTFVQTDSWTLMHLTGAPQRAAAESQTIAAGHAVLLDPGTVVKLKMRDGSKLEGRFLGRTLLDSSLYIPRFDKYVRSSSYVPFARGETLHVALRDGREWTAPFAGYAELALLLAIPEGLEGAETSTFLRVPFEFAREIHRANGAAIDPADLAGAFAKRELPSAEALVLGERGVVGSAAEEWASALRVPVEDIKSVTAQLSSGGTADTRPQADHIAGAIILGVLVGVVLIAIVAAGSASGSSGCTSSNGPWLMAEVPPGVHLTRRAFDRTRGCYVGDALVVATPWPGTSEVPATALADPAGSTGSTR
jgi:hypothetical protein